MSGDDLLVIEPERYELAAGPAYRFGVARRDLLRALGGGLLVLALSPAGADARQGESGGGRRGGGNGGGQPQEVGAWLHVGADGRVTAYTGKVEVGQNARTSLTQAVADELRLPPGRVTLVMGDTDLTPFDAGTFGSRTTPAMAPQMRRAAAVARETMAGMAAARLGAGRSSLAWDADEARFRDPATGRTCGIGELAAGQELVRAVVAADAPTTPRNDWKTAGTSLPKVDGRDFVTGRHRYTSDIVRPGMLYGRVVRPSAFGATLATLDDREARAIPGAVVVRDGDFVGVAAPNTRTAARAAEAVRATWTPPAGGPPPSDRELFALLKSTAQDGGGNGGQAKGTPAEALAAAKHRLEATYTVAYIAHAPLEPRAAVAEWEGDKLTVWTGTQRPFGVRGELAAAFGIPESRVRVIVPDTGSGYGGKHTGEAAIEAARLAKGAGKPVKLVWTREEEFTWAYFRPAGVIEVKAGADADGALTAWEFDNFNSGTAALGTPYDVPNQRVAFHPSRSPLRQGSYRGLAATANHFARESHLNEMAEMVGRDPLAFRLKNLKDDRLRAVLEAAASAFGWGKGTAPAGRGYGIAGGVDKGGYVASCAEVEVAPPDAKGGRKVRVVRVATAFECGAVVNPEHLKNQVEGAVVQGLGGALFEVVGFAKGQVTNPRFSEYRVPRFRDVPALTTVLLDRRDLPSAGAGECPIVAVAPAIAGALHAAAGVRLRSLPLLDPEGRLPSATA
jgi:isoquinoline 1-oxidoreductase